MKIIGDTNLALAQELSKNKEMVIKLDTCYSSEENKCVLSFMEIKDKSEENTSLTITDIFFNESHKKILESKINEIDHDFCDNRCIYREICSVHSDKKIKNAVKTMEKEIKELLGE